MIYTFEAHDVYVADDAFQAAADRIAGAVTDSRMDDALGEVFAMDVFAAAIMVHYIAERVLMPTTSRFWLGAVAERAAALRDVRRTP